MKRLLVLIGLVALVAPGAAVRAAGAKSPAETFANGHGLKVLKVTQFDDRDYNVSVLSPYLGRPIDIRLLLPAGYAAHPDTRYPVLYLFHGTSGVASDWVKGGHAEQSTAPYKVITVMPEVGFGGDGGFWFTNWVDKTTSHGPSQFEDYLIKSLIPWVDQNLRTIADRKGRAVAGLSQGGYGSAEMAARHPDLFCSLATFSGAPEIARDADVYPGAIAVIEAIEVGDDHVPPFSELGNPVTNRINWEGHDPATLMENLRGMSIDMWTGEGINGPYDSGPDPAGSGIEALVYESTRHFYNHLLDQHIPAYYDDYVYGTHSFPYWARDLKAYLPKMMADFAHPKSPQVVSYTTIDKKWSQWGYSVSIDRTAEQEFSSLTEGTARGFTFEGSGTATITTPGDYRPGSAQHVTLSIGAKAPSTSTVHADSKGRITLHVALGPQDQVAIVAIRPAS